METEAHTYTDATGRTWKRMQIPHEYNFEGCILEFSNEDHLDSGRFLLCEGGFGARSYLSGRMLIGNFGATLEEALKPKTEESGGNTKAFPVAMWVVE